MVAQLAHVRCNLLLRGEAPETLRPGRLDGDLLPPLFMLLPTQHTTEHGGPGGEATWSHTGGTSNHGDDKSEEETKHQGGEATQEVGRVLRS